MISPRRRRTARLIILDVTSRVLLVRYAEHRPGRGNTYWATPGGGIEEGESARDAAVRELRGETGLSAAIGAMVFEELNTFELPSGWVAQEEEYFLVQLQESAPSVRNSSPEPILEHRWWQLGDLLMTTETIYPLGLAARLRLLGSAA